MDFGYEIILQPALYAAALLAVVIALFKGAGRVDTDTGRRFRLGPKASRRALLTLTISALLLPAVVVTPPGHRAAIYSLGSGVSPDERGEGVSLIFPYAQTARMVNVRTQVFSDSEVFAQSADLQEITVHIAVNYHVDPGHAAELYQQIGLGYEQTVIRPAVLQLVKEEVGLVKAADFAVNREALARDIEAGLSDQLSGYGVVIEFVNIEDAVFDSAFIKAVKDKVIAIEKATEQFNLIAAEEHKKSQVILQAEAEEQKRLIEARGESEAIREVAAALGFTSDEYLEWLLIGAWSGNLPQTILGDIGEFGILLAP